MPTQNDITVEIQQYPNTQVAVFRRGGASVYIPLAEAQPLLDRGDYTWREVCDLPSNRDVQHEMSRRRDSLREFAGGYAAARMDREP